MKHLQEDATNYGERLGALTSFYQESYNTAMKNPPVSPQKVITCKGGKKKCGIGPLLIALDGGLLLVLIVLLLVKQK
jgi:hypothetical protein